MSVNSNLRGETRLETLAGIEALYYGLTKSFRDNIHRKGIFDGNERWLLC